MQTDCEHPKHKKYLKAFLKKYPTANKDAHFAVNLVDPDEWYVQDDPKKNTVMCCQMCGITEGILRSNIRNISTPGYGAMDRTLKIQPFHTIPLIANQAEYFVNKTSKV